MKRLLKILAAVFLLISVTACTKKETSEDSEIIHVEIAIKDYGTMLVELYPDVAPETVENFVKLVKENFYDGNSFHRIIDGFMIQGGMDTSGNVKRIKGEFASNGFDNELKHTEGVISMARAKDPDSASSQFFIMVGDAPWLDGEYAAFGKVIDGLQVAKKIASDARPVDNNGSIAESDRPIIESIRIVE